MVFIEDLVDGDDGDGFTKAVQTIDRSIILGDDLIVTNPERLERAVKTSAVDGAPRSRERIEKLNFLLRAAERIPDCALADVPALVRF
jgi:Enolase, C-terminal TIM barrel domain